MRESNRWRRAAAAAGVLALVTAACGNGDDEDADDDAATGDIVFDDGVTEEPCPDAVNDGNGCIYLGILSDLTEGPFAGLAVPITEGQRAFWRTVNEAGGIAGFDVNIDEYTRDNKYDPQEHSAQYRQIEPDILALAQSLGTPTTEAVLPDMDVDDMIAAPASWWSGWSFEERDNGLILESGYSYCIESMIVLDWHAAERGQPSSVMAVGYPTDYGRDNAAGVEAWAEANGVEYLGFVETAPTAQIATQDAAVGQIVNGSPDVVLVATGPAEMAEIVGESAAQEFQGQFLGSAPTWNPALLETPAAPALEAFYTQIVPWEGFETGESAAHEAMRAALDGELPANEGFTSGWIWSYPIKALLETAAANGDLTRAGLRAAVDGLEVDYEGALPTATFGGDPNETVERTAAISQPDPDSELGVSTIATGVTGSTADDYDYATPCAG